MYDVPAEVLDAIAEGFAYRTRATILDPDLVPIVADVPLADFTVSVDANAIIRRSGSASLPNDLGTWTLSPAGPLWLANPIRLEFGIYAAGGFVWIPLITGYPDEPEEEVTKRASVISLPFRDRLKLLDDVTFTAPITFPADMPLEDGARALCVMGGLGDVEALYDLDSGGQTFGVDHAYEVDKRLLDVLAQWALDFAVDLYASPLGVVTMRPRVDPSLATPVVTYDRGRRVDLGDDHVPLLGFRRRVAAAIRNRVVVIGEDPYGRPVRYELRDLNPASPTYNPYPPEAGPLGDHPYVYRSLSITTYAQAEAVAMTLLSEGSYLTETLNFQVPPNPAHEGRDVIAISESWTGTAGKYALDTFTFAGKPGPMPATAKIVRSLVA